MRVPSQARLLLAAGLIAVVAVSVQAAQAATPVRPVAVAVTGNPLAPVGDFQLFTDGDTSIVSSVPRPVAVGGTLQPELRFTTVGANTAGSFVATGDLHPAALVAGGFQVSGQQVLTIGSHGYAKIGNLGPFVATDTDGSGNTGADTQIVETTYGSTPRVQLGVSQPVTSVGPTHPLDFAAAFATLSSTASAIDTCTPTGTVDEDSRTLTIVPGTVNVFDINVNDKLWRGRVHLTNPPGPHTPLIINLRGTTTPAGVRLGSLLVLPPQSQYVLYNYADSAPLVVATDAFGTLLAPNAHVSLPAATIWGTLVANSVTNARFANAPGFATAFSCANPGPGGGYGTPRPSGPNPGYGH